MSYKKLKRKGARLVRPRSKNKHNKKAAEYMPISKIIDRIVNVDADFVVFHGAEVINGKGEPTGDVYTVRVPLLNADAIALRYIEQAQVDNKILVDLINRNSGKPVETTRMINGEDDAGFRIVLK